MDLFSGSQISSFLSATSLMWASTFILAMVGLVYFIKFQERHDTIKHSPFFILYILTIILNGLEYYMNIVMQNNPSFEVIIYKIYILLKFFWIISVVFYIINYINEDGKFNITIIRIIKSSLMLVSIFCCILLNVDTTLEINGKFYVLTGSLNTTFNVVNLLLLIFLLVIVIVFRKRMPKGFLNLAIYISVINTAIIIFINTTGFVVNESVFIYSLLLLAIFNTTSNQDTEFVNKLDEKTNDLMNINNRRNKLINKIMHYFGDTINNLILYNDELSLSTEHNKELIQNQSKEISKESIELMDNLYNFKEIFMIEANMTPSNNKYQLNTFVDDVKSNIYAQINNKDINFSTLVDENCLLNYIGDANKIKTILINFLYNVLNITDAGQEVILKIASIKINARNIGLNITIENKGNEKKVDVDKYNVYKYIDSNENYNTYELKMVIANSLLKLLNSKIETRVDGNNTIYTFTIIQGFVDNELYNNIK